jgi:hypothetical protein
MYFGLYNLIKRFKRAMKKIPINEEGKHPTTIEDVIEYLQWLIDDDDYDYFDEDNDCEDEEEYEDD